MLAIFLGALVVITALGLAAVRDPAVREVFGRLRRLPNRQKVGFVRALVLDGRLPLAVRVIPWLLVAYLLLPFDIVPDFIPFLGQLDDVAIVVLALWLMMRLMPPALLAEHLAQAEVRAASRGAGEISVD
ncbi:MAG: DUF1232 domain-containing protein [Dehalococcoidia bacterium]|nr:DUF1232 domain-containing protein [Dehalococcoidia bacterium]